MKKTIKKLFRVEVVIAVTAIAVILVIAVPALMGVVEKAWFQADHANVCTALAMAKSANQVGTFEGVLAVRSKVFELQKDGTVKEMGAADSKPYITRTNGSFAGCAVSTTCPVPGHEKGKKICFDYNDVEEKWEVKFMS